MLRFFSRRKAKGRAEQKVGSQARRGPANGSKPNKNVLACNIILLDGSDLGLDIGVSITSCKPKKNLFFVPKSFG